jgi:hypothetical protein
MLVTCPKYERPIFLSRVEEAQWLEDMRLKLGYAFKNEVTNCTTLPYIQTNTLNWLEMLPLEHDKSWARGEDFIGFVTFKTVMLLLVHSLIPRYLSREQKKSLSFNHNPKRSAVESCHLIWLACSPVLLCHSWRKYSQCGSNIWHSLSVIPA